MIDVSTRESRARFYCSREWQELREAALARDNYECVWCKRQGRVTTDEHSVLEIDHIKELKDYPELALELDNTRTLCKDCHNKRHKRFNYRPRSKGNRLDNKFPESWE